MFFSKTSNHVNVHYLSRITKEFWQTLAKDKDLTQDTFDHLLDILHRAPPFTEKEDARDKKVSSRTATVLPVAVCTFFLQST